MINLVVAQANNRVIGSKNDLPWYLPADLKRFKEITTGKPVIMGRKTFQSIYGRLGKALPNRENIVVSRNAKLAAPGAKVVTSLDKALALHPEQEVYVIGGAQIYEEALPAADRIYLTQVHADVEGDAYLPELDPEQWRVTDREWHDADEKHKYAFEWLTLERVV
jgi:dihydrofolate reductase